MSDYGTMQARIADELSRSDLTSQIKTAIQSAIRFFESERFWFNETEATASTVADQQSYAVPTDLLEVDALTLTNSNVRDLLRPRSWNWIRNNSDVATATAIPTDWAYYADQFWLYPVPDAVYTITVSYLQRLAALSASSDTNAWMTHGEELIRSRAKADLYANLIGDMDQAVAMAAISQAALSNLQGKSLKKISTGRLDPTIGVLTGRGFNINTD